MGVAIPANEVAERGERIRSASRPTAGSRSSTRPPTGNRRSRRPRRGPRPVPRGGLVRGPAQAIRAAFLSADTYPNVAMFEGMSPGAVQRLVREPQHVGGRAGFWGLDSAAPLVAGTFDAARAAVDVALTAMDLVLGGETAAYGLCRPPGHHAARSMYGGYCFLNNAAIVAHAITAATGERVGILDVDYHHGNGSQQIFWQRGDVRYVSIHADPSGRTRTSSGAPTRLVKARAPVRTEHPAPGGCHNADYLEATDRAIDALAEAPGSIVVVSLGFDTYGLDPIGDFALTTEVYHEVGRRVAALGRRLVILQEGGYHRPSLGENARSGCVAPRGGRSTHCRPPGSASTGRSADPGTRPDDARTSGRGARAAGRRPGGHRRAVRPAAAVGSTSRPLGRSSTSCSSSRYRWPRHAPHSIAWSRRPIR